LEEAQVHWKVQSNLKNGSAGDIRSLFFFFFFFQEAEVQGNTKIQKLEEEVSIYMYSSGLHKEVNGIDKTEEPTCISIR